MLKVSQIQDLCSKLDTAVMAENAQVQELLNPSTLQTVGHQCTTSSAAGGA